MSNHKRILAFIFAAFIVIVMFLSSAFIISHAEHDCVGGGCAICSTLCVCEESLRMMSFATIAGVLVSTKSSASCGAFFHAIVFSYITLVSLKVKLSN